MSFDRQFDAKIEEQDSSNPHRQLTYAQLMLCAFLIGAVGGFVATTYYFVLEALMHGAWHVIPEWLEPYFPSWLPSQNYVWIATTVGGFCVGLALYFLGLPGEMAQVVKAVHDPGRIDIRKTPAMLIALAKMFAISFTLHSGFLGGFIFPLFFIGANVGFAISLAVPQVHPTVGMVCLIAAVNVAVTKTPVSTSIILMVLSGTAMLPVIAIASFVSFILTSNISMIKTQRSRSVEEFLTASSLPQLSPIPALSIEAKN